MIKQAVFRNPVGIVWCVALFISVTAGCDQQPAKTETTPTAVVHPASAPDFAKPIESVIRQDRENQRRCFAHPDKAKGHTEYLASMAAIDLRGCPEEFQSAFLDFKASWVKYIDFHREYPETVGGIARQLMLVVMDNRDFPKESKALMAVIEQKWLECEKIALRYGVDIR